MPRMPVVGYWPTTDVLLLAKFFAKSVPRSIAMANTDAGVLLPAAASPYSDLRPGFGLTAGAARGVRTVFSVQPD